MESGYESKWFASTSYLFLGHAPVFSRPLFLKQHFGELGKPYTFPQIRSGTETHTHIHTQLYIKGFKIKTFNHFWWPLARV